MADNIFCTNCGSKIEPDTAFCTSCGAPVNAGSQVGQTEVLNPVVNEVPNVGQTEVLNPVVNEIQNAPVNGIQVPNGAPAFAPVAPVSPTAYPTAPVQKPKKKLSKGKIIAIVVAAIVAVAAVVAGVIAIKIFSNPFYNIGKGYKKLVTSGKTYKISIEAGEYDGKKMDEGIKGSADVKFDLKNRYIAVDNVKAKEMYSTTYDWENDRYLDEPIVKEYDMMEGVTVKGYIDANNKEAGFVFKESDEDYNSAIYFYNGIATMEEDGEVYNNVLVLNEENFNDVIDILGDSLAMIAGEKVDEKAYIEKVMAFAEKNLPEEAKGYMPSDIYDIVPEKDIDNIFKKLEKKFADTKWLKDNFGYEKSKADGETIYSFEISYKSLEALQELLEEDIEVIVNDAYEYAKSSDDFKDLIDDEFNVEDIMDEMMEEVDYLIDTMKEEKIKANISFGVKKGVLSSIKFSYEDIKATITFEETDDISVSKSDVNKYYDAAKKELAGEPDLLNYQAVIDNADNKTCANNIKTIKNNAANYYAIYDCTAIAGLDELEDMFDGGYLPWCPVDGEDYLIQINPDGSAVVECPNCGKGNHNPSGSSKVTNPLPDYAPSYDYFDDDNGDSAVYPYYGDDDAPIVSDDYYDYFY